MFTIQVELWNRFSAKSFVWTSSWHGSNGNIKENCC